MDKTQSCEYIQTYICICIIYIQNTTYICINTLVFNVFQYSIVFIILKIHSETSDRQDFRSFCCRKNHMSAHIFFLRRLLVFVFNSFDYFLNLFLSSQYFFQQKLIFLTLWLLFNVHKLYHRPKYINIHACIYFIVYIYIYIIYLTMY